MNDKTTTVVTEICVWRAVCIINNVDVSKYNFGPRQRGRGLVGVTDVGVVYTHRSCELHVCFFCQ